MSKHLYTKTGDAGMTGVFLGSTRVSKGSPLIEAVGQLDALVSTLGVARASLDGAINTANVVLKLQKYLFIASADLITQPSSRSKLEPGISAVDEEMVMELEDMINMYELVSPPPTEFIVPGANMPSALLDLARTQVRAAERSVVRVVATQEVNPELLKFLNRLSDLLYAMARVVAGTHEERSRLE